jgi:hypothetical protein
MTRYFFSDVISSDDLSKAKSDFLISLYNHIVKINFTKSDGTVREMRCTMISEKVDDLVLAQVLTEDSAVNAESTNKKKQKPHNPNVQVVVDVDSNSWRSFRWDRLISWEVEK